MASGEIVVATLTLDFTKDGDGDGFGKNGNLRLEQIEGKSYALFAGNVEVISHEVVGGSKTGGGVYTKAIEDYVTFANSTDSSLPYPPDGSVEFEPIGQAYSISDTGAVTPASFGKPETAADGSCRISSKGIALYKVKYTAKGQQFTAVTSLPVVLVFAVGRVK
jgi:hypothetical protein